MTDTINTEKHADDNLAVLIERLDNLKAENSKEHNQIFEQVKKTNGTVADLVWWKGILIGALIILNLFIVPVIVAILIQFATNNIFK
jgi:hypothetical protein